MKRFMTVVVAILLLNGVGMHQDKAQAEVVPFSDVTSSFWAYKELLFLKEHSIIGTNGELAYYPNRPETRKEAAKKLALALGLDERTLIIRPTIPDVPESDSYYPYIASLVERGIFTGKTDGRFDPNGTLTRAQMAKILTKAFNLQATSTKSFPDVPKTHWAYDYVTALYSNDITTGSNGYYKPEDTLNRGQYGVFLYRVLSSDSVFESRIKIQSIINQHPNIFEEGVTINAVGYNQLPNLQKILNDGLPFAEQNHMKIFGSISDGVQLRTPGYQSKVPRNFYEFSYGESINSGEFSIRYDFRSSAAHQLAKDWIELINPEFKQLISIIDSKV